MTNIYVQTSPHNPAVATIEVNDPTLGQLIRDALTEFGFTLEKYGGHVAIYTYDAEPDTSPVLGEVEL